MLKCAQNGQKRWCSTLLYKTGTLCNTITRDERIKRIDWLKIKNTVLNLEYSFNYSQCIPPSPGLTIEGCGWIEVSETWERWIKQPQLCRAQKYTLPSKLTETGEFSETDGSFPPSTWFKGFTESYMHTVHSLSPLSVLHLITGSVNGRMSWNPGTGHLISNNKQCNSF